MNIHVEVLRLTERVAALEKKWAELEAEPAPAEPEKKSAVVPEQQRKTG